MKVCQYELYILGGAPIHFAWLYLMNLCSPALVCSVSPAGVVKDEPCPGRDDYLEAVSPERSLPAEETYSDAEQEEEGDEEEEEEQDEEEDAPTEGSAPEEDEEEEEEDEGEDEEEELEEGRGVILWEQDDLHIPNRCIALTNPQWAASIWGRVRGVCLLWHAASCQQPLDATSCQLPTNIHQHLAVPPRTSPSPWLTLVLWSHTACQIHPAWQEVCGSVGQCVCGNMK